MPRHRRRCASSTCRKCVPTSHPLADPRNAAARFERVRALLPASFHATVKDLENICEEERQLRHQSRLHLVLHGWQLVHVPLSMALLALALVHVFMALRF
jgi:hypothetical protein